MPRSLFAFALISVLSMVPWPTSAAAPGANPWVIYGDDNRTEVFEATDHNHQVLAESVVAIMTSAVVTGQTLKTQGVVTITGPIYGDDAKLCSTERFIEQTATAYCTGFLVAPDIIATAGHCVEDTDFCDDARFVFGYMKTSAGHDPNQVTHDDVYSCKKVLAHKVSNTGSDYALVQLDREVTGRAPLVFAEKSPAVAEEIAVIGHPSGLPMKVSAGAAVRSKGRGFYVANLDSFEGNSGSPVFNDKYEVAGVLVRGEADFVPHGSCFVSNHCDNNLCDGEEVTNPDVVAKALSRFDKKL